MTRPQSFRQIAVLTLLLCAAPLRAQTAPPQPQPVQLQAGPIDSNSALLLMRSALIALDQANKTNEYYVLRALASEGFQVNTTGRLSEIFAPQRRDGLNLAYAAIMEPRWTVEPQIERSGMIHMAGYFDVKPVAVGFDLLFAQEKGQWLLFGVSVGRVQPQPASAEPAAPAQPEPPKPAAPAPRTPPKR